MSYVLFHILSGEKLAEFSEESDARKALREKNGSLGLKRENTCWQSGFELEWCFNGRNFQYSEYAITETNRWHEKFSPFANLAYS